MKQQDGEWKYDLTDVTEDKSRERTVMKPNPEGQMQPAFELVGIEGNRQGGLRPFPGFVKVHEFDGFQSDANHDETSDITDHYTFSTRVGTEGYTFGIVYRVKRKDPNTTDAADVFIDYWNSLAGGDPDTRWTKGERVIEDITTTTRMSVVKTERIVYIFIEGREPAAFWLDRNSPYPLMRLGQSDSASFPGPGQAPEFANADQSYTLGGLTTIPAGADSRGQVFISTNTPTEINTASSLGLVQADDDVQLMEPGDYSFAYILVDSKTGRRSAMSKISAGLAGAWYSGGTPGVGTLISQYVYIEIVWDSNKYDQAYIFRSIDTEQAGGPQAAGILHLEIIIDLLDYETSNVLTPTTNKQAVYGITITDIQLVFQKVWIDSSIFDEKMPKGGSALLYENTMLVSNLKSSEVSTDQENREYDDRIGVGETRYSSLSERNVEMFPPGNRLIPSDPTGDIIRFVKVGANVIGWSDDDLTVFRKESVTLKSQPMHDSYGLVGDRAASHTGSAAFFVTPRGMKAVAEDGTLDAIQFLDYLIKEEWGASRNDLKNISMATDSEVGVIFTLNPDTDTYMGSMVCQWYDPPKITELIDIPFDQVTDGQWPSAFDLTDENGTLENDLVKKASFILNYPRENASDMNAGWNPQLYMMDHKRVRQYGGHDRIAMLDLDNDLRFETTNIISILDYRVNLDVGSETLPTDPSGALLYVIECTSDTSYEGKKAVVQYKFDADTLQLIDGADLGGLPIGSRVAISPIFVEAGGYPLQGGAGRNLMNQKHVDSLRAVFTDVAGEANDDVTNDQDAKFWGLVYEGNASVESATGRSTGEDGLLRKTIIEGNTQAVAFGDPTSTTNLGFDGAIVSPAIRIICPDLDFRLLEVEIRGAVRGTKKAD